MILGEITFELLEAAAGSVPYKKFFLKVLQNPQENIRVNKVAG